MGCFLSLLRHSNSPFKRCFSRRRPIYFEGPARRQNFAFADPIMYYIAKNASSAIAYRKLVQSCKYFFIKRPLIVISCLHQTKDGFYTCLIDKKGIERFDMEKLSTKLWLSSIKSPVCIPVKASDAPTSPFPIKKMISKIYQIEAAGFEWKNVTFNFEELVFFSSRSAKSLHLQDCTIEYENGEAVQLETLLAQFPSLQYFFYTCRPDGSNVSANTIKEILANPNFSKMKAFHLLEIPDTFDIDCFYTYLKSRNDFYCCLNFRADIAADYYERVEAIIDELLSTESTGFRFPCIIIPNMHPETINAIKERFEEDCKRHNIKSVALHL